jgi:hypothetical protein
MFDFEQVSVTILKLKSGESFIGTLTQTSDRPWKDKKGIEKTIKQFHFDQLDEKTGEVSGQIIYFGDGGFQNAVSMAGITIGDTIKAVKGGKSDIGEGRSVNNYEIYKAKK